MQSTRTARIHLPVIKTAGRLGVAWTLTWIVLSIDVLWLLLADGSKSLGCIRLVVFQALGVRVLGFSSTLTDS
jgi:hypothetical protein